MRFITLMLMALMLSGCSGLDTVKESVSGVRDYFTGGADNADPPSALVEYTPEINAEVLWDESVGVGTDEQTGYW
jgi:outer membrane protein assembly factor BamB